MAKPTANSATMLVRTHIGLPDTAAAPNWRLRDPSSPLGAKRERAAGHHPAPLATGPFINSP
jgi:hypothetical protein